MKYKLFALSILTSAMLGCASHPMQSAKHLPLNQQVYQGYEKLMSKQSYAFEGRMTFKMEMDEAKNHNTPRLHHKKSNNVSKY